jgi:nucleoside-diphosphate-sugar epimerase
MRLDDGRVMADFVRDRLANQPIRVLGGGHAIRAFCYTADAAAGFWQALLSDQHGEPFNIGNDQEPITIRDLAHLVAELEPPRLDVQVEAADTPEHLRGSPSRVCPDLTKARNLLRYRPEVDLRSGLRRTLAWYHGGSET